IAFHLAAGAGLIVVPNDVPEAAARVLEPFERRGQGRIAAPGPVDAGWVLTPEPGAFWWPRGVGLEGVLGAVPRRYGVLRSIERRFIPTGVGTALNDRMQRRDAVAYDGPVATRRGASGLIPLRGWRPCEVFVIPEAGSSSSEESTGAAY